MLPQPLIYSSKNTQGISSPPAAYAAPSRGGAASEPARMPCWGSFTAPLPASNLWAFLPPCPRGRSKISLFSAQGNTMCKAPQFTTSIPMLLGQQRLQCFHPPFSGVVDLSIDWPVPYSCGTHPSRQWMHLRLGCSPQFILLVLRLNAWLARPNASMHFQTAVYVKGIPLTHTFKRSAPVFFVGSQSALQPSGDPPSVGGVCIAVCPATCLLYCLLSI